MQGEAVVPIGAPHPVATQGAREGPEEHLDAGGERRRPGARIADAGHAFTRRGRSHATHAHRARWRNRLAIGHGPVVGVHVVRRVIEFTIQARFPTANEELSGRRRQADLEEQWGRQLWCRSSDGNHEPDRKRRNHDEVDNHNEATMGEHHDCLASRARRACECLDRQPLF